MTDTRHPNQLPPKGTWSEEARELQSKRNTEVALEVEKHSFDDELCAAILTNDKWWKVFLMLNPDKSLEERMKPEARFRTEPIKRTPKRTKLFGLI